MRRVSLSGEISEGTSVKLPSKLATRPELLSLRNTYSAGQIKSLAAKMTEIISVKYFGKSVFLFEPVPHLEAKVSGHSRQHLERECSAGIRPPQSHQQYQGYLLLENEGEFQSGPSWDYHGFDWVSR